MHLDLQKTVAFTGHRPTKLGGYDESNPIAVYVKTELRKEIERFIEEGFTTFISGGALGVDQMAAEIVIEKKADLIIARPFPSQHVKWIPSAQKRFFAILAQARDVIDVSPDPYQIWKMQTRNIWMVDHSSFLIAVYDGSGGGTGNCIEYAQKIGRPIRVINPSF